MNKNNNKMENKWNIIWNTPQDEMKKKYPSIKRNLDIVFTFLFIILGYLFLNFLFNVYKAKTKLEDNERFIYNVSLVLVNSKDTINTGNVKEYDDFLLILKDSSKIMKSKIVWSKASK